MTTTRREDPLSSLGRFTEPSVLILAALAGGPRHGYSIMLEAERMSGQPLGPGTLYASLARLERRSLIAALPPEGRRRPYRISGLGAEVLEAHLQGLRQFANAALASLDRGAT
jgi:DNA-binding PadR family transcriptional regulator